MRSSAQRRDTWPITEAVKIIVQCIFTLNYNCPQCHQSCAVDLLGRYRTVIANNRLELLCVAVHSNTGLNEGWSELLCGIVGWGEMLSVVRCSHGEFRWHCGLRDVLAALRGTCGIRSMTAGALTDNGAYWGGAINTAIIRGRPWWLWAFLCCHFTQLPAFVWDTCILFSNSS